MINHLIFIILIFLGYFVLKSSLPYQHKNTRLFINYVCMVLIFQSALRHIDVGVDTYTYFREFEKVKSISWSEVMDNFKYVYVESEGKDAGYLLLEKCFQVFCKSFRVFLFFVAGLFFSAYAQLLKRYLISCSEVLMSALLYLLLFYSFFSITGIRQTIAVALSIHAFLSLSDKSWLKYILLTIFAFFIHKSAIILLLFPLFLFTVKPKKIATISILLFPISIIYRSDLVAAFRGLADYDVYEVGLPIKLMLLFFMLSIWIFYNVYKGRMPSDSYDLVKIFAITFSWIPLLGWDSLFMREILYFSIYFLLLIPICIRVLPFRERNLLYIVTMTATLILFLISSEDYSFYWQGL